MVSAAEFEIVSILASHVIWGSWHADFSVGSFKSDCCWNWGRRTQSSECVDLRVTVWGVRLPSNGQIPCCNWVQDWSDYVWDNLPWVLTSAVVVHGDGRDDVTRLLQDSHGVCLFNITLFNPKLPTICSSISPNKLIWSTGNLPSVCILSAIDMVTWTISIFGKVCLKYSCWIVNFDRPKLIRTHESKQYCYSFL